MQKMRTELKATLALVGVALLLIIGLCAAFVLGAQTGYNRCKSRTSARVQQAHNLVNTLRLRPQSSEDLLRARFLQFAYSKVEMLPGFRDGDFRWPKRPEDSGAGARFRRQYRFFSLVPVLQPDDLIVDIDEETRMGTVKVKANILDRGSESEDMLSFLCAMFSRWQEREGQWYRLPVKYSELKDQL